MSPTELPNKAKASTPAGKIAGYLLSETHAVGRSKARFFRSFGFDEATAGQLEEGLLAIAHTQEVKESLASPHGTKYIIDGFLKTPRGGNIRIRTIWIVDAGQRNPRFVTAYPVD